MCSFCHVFVTFFFLKRKPSFEVLECLGVLTVSVLNSPLTKNLWKNFMETLFVNHPFKDVIKDIIFTFPINLESKIPLNITRVII